MNRNSISRRNFITAAAGSVASGLAFATPRIARAATRIRIGIGGDPSYAGFYLAKSERLFEAEGVDVDLRLYTDGSEAMNALGANQVDVSASGESPTMLRMQRLPLRPLAVFYESGRNIKVVLGKNIASAKDIRKFGIVKGSVSQYCALLTMKKENLPADKVSFLVTGTPEFPALLARGDIDAFCAWEPWPQTAVKAGGHIAMTSEEVGYHDTQWVNTTAAVLESNPDGLRAMLRAIDKASKICMADPERAAQAVYDITKIPKQVSLSNMPILTLGVRDFTPKDIESYNGIAAFLADNAVTEKLVPFEKDLQIGFYKG